MTEIVTRLEFGSFTNDTTVGSHAWNSVANAAASDNTYADSTGAAGVYTYYLTGYNSPSKISPDSVIYGIEGGIENFCTINLSTLDNSVKLYVDGAPSGTDQKKTSYGGYSAERIIPYGSPTDLWGLSLHGSVINDANFGLCFSCINALSPASAAYVDWMYLDIHHEPGRMMTVF